MFATNNGHVPGSNTPIKKALQASNLEGIVADTNSADFRSHGAIQQADDGKTFFPWLTAAYADIKDAVSGFYLERGVSIEVIVTLILAAVFGAVRAMQ